MVFFNCNGCGEALKKNQVEKHSLRCRQCQVLSCVDCGKDFWGNDYQNHTKCMTENEKYCGKGYVPKVNKGEVKQEQWIEKVQSAIEKSASNPKLKGVLERLKDYPNIPRKKIKFENFLKNSLRVGSQPLISQVWDTLMAAAGQAQDEKQSGPGTDNKSENGSASQVSNTAAGLENGDMAPSGEAEAVEISSHKLSKRERKEERRKKANKKEKKDKSVENGDVEEGHRKGKKRKHEESEEMGQEDTSVVTTSIENTDNPQPDKKKKKKKHKSVTEDVTDENAPTNGETQLGENEDESSNETEEPKKKKSKFNWEATVIAVLKSKGEMSMKRLSKKVLSEFAAQDAANYSQENLQAKLEKKLKKLSQVKVHKDRVKLK